jgi:uncharacterized protein YbjT (DUF2867 family)
MTPTRSSSTVLLTGGTGRTGARIARRLADRGISVRTASRRADVPFDWDDAGTWSQALSGVRAVYLCYSPDLAFPGVPELMHRFSDAAREAGVTRLVLLSGRGEAGAEASERVVRSSGLEWTVLRSAWFAQNFSEHFLLGPVRRGRLLLPADAAVAEPFLDLDDLADVAADALSTNQHVGRLLELTGPRLLTLSAVAAELSAATGRSVVFEPATPADFAADVARDGIPVEDALPLAGLFTDILDGRNASLTPDLRVALCREPTDFAAYAARTAATGVWAAPAPVATR